MMPNCGLIPRDILASLDFDSMSSLRVFHFADIDVRFTGLRGRASEGGTV